jgi:membrane-bound lytic murein transglycosylase B
MKRQIILATIVALLSFPAIAKAPDSKPINLEPAKFKIWLDGFEKEALSKGIKQSTLDESLKNIKPIKKIIELDRRQPEFTMTFAQYIQNIVPKSRKNKARKRMNANDKLLTEISKKYGVQKRFIVALWGVETDFGDRMGSYYIPEALATLAFEGRRHEFFRKELMNSIIMIDQGDIEAKKMKGSWAGAMGQTQFMPSSYLAYAVDYDGDGKKDIWGTKADAFASIANYLKNTKWDNNLTWGRKVTPPKKINKDWIKKDKKLSEWQKLGFRKANGDDLPKRDLVAMLSMPDGKNGDAFLVYDNYKRILKWNRSDYFATAVGYLSDSLR